MSPVIHALNELCRSFGRMAARTKLDLLKQIIKLEAVSSRDLLVLQDTLDFLRAYPDNAAVRQRVGRAVARMRQHARNLRHGPDTTLLRNTGLPGSTTRYCYSYQVLRRLARRFPTCLEIDWDDLSSDVVLASTLELLLTPAENEGMEDVAGGWHDWVENGKSSPSQSDLEFLLQLFEDSDLDQLQQANLFENCELPLRYDLEEPGTGRCEVEVSVPRVQYQTRELSRERFPPEPEIRRTLHRPAPLSPARAEKVIATCLAALCCRSLEIYPLIWASHRDVTIFPCARGVQVLLAGVPVEHRGPLGANYLFVVMKNGVPVGYGPANPFLGCCEMGVNLFPEFRGSEVRFFYSQVMRVLHHVLAVEYFYLMPYGMGVGNPEAIQSGAFWFYRKLGFVPSDPGVEALARLEEERMQQDSDHRSSVATLHRLSRTDAYLDLSKGRCRRFPFHELGLRVSQFVAETFAGSRRAARKSCTQRVRRALDVRSVSAWSAPERMMLERLALTLAMIPDLHTWRASERAALVRIIRAKASASEAPAAALWRRHTRLEKALRQIVATDATSRSA